MARPKLPWTTPVLTDPFEMDRFPPLEKLKRPSRRDHIPSKVAKRLAGAGKNFQERWKRIGKLDPEAIKIADVVRRDFIDIRNRFGVEAALDINTHAIESYQLRANEGDRLLMTSPRKGKGAPKGSRDQLKDNMLLDLHDVAIKGMLVGHPEVDSITKLVMFLNSRGWGGAGALEGRIKKPSPNVTNKN